jgi:uncharacterized damage-inducible protein DinB
MERRPMKSDNTIRGKVLEHALSGKGAHVAAQSIFEGLDWKLAGTRPEGTPHSVFEILNHLSFWQDWVVKWLAGQKPAIPKHASGSWPGGACPASKQEWEAAVRSFRKGLEELAKAPQKANLLEKRGKSSPLEMLHAIASHNSYHLGQVVVLRQILGAWPPPSGGLTW